ncbi:hypothetical protein RB2123 [Rhodopirellula baltica SH 1]|uniref:Uncharacterized protein n=1 Tax=Rhodopirellula baltica (strain DSM 10527 / NCIMB 13988 / SH1) TaxID=243090 RepID=Q7UWC5_RHOBA|nr:hypothetical protein RB2123 [Rhodopirellula baltica SH 1]
MTDAREAPKREPAEATTELADGHQPRLASDQPPLTRYGSFNQQPANAKTADWMHCPAWQIQSHPPDTPPHS